ncbi:DDE-type integrase/transposase/recombinase [Micromonospora viridifaciens]|uniref:DDE-type integrase/transposase/recombinase n=1 Tax=Micromonospora viridifaciens TaxID=1881 RepID=UPI0012FD26AF|nr:DDE-type integrase/transposase/recombinase [Micromonospora viridifaciens]
MSLAWSACRRTRSRATVIDLASRRIVGWEVADHLHTWSTPLSPTPSSGAGPPPGWSSTPIAAQYTSAQHARLAARHGVRLSVGRRGQCWDNSVAESFFATIKCQAQGLMESWLAGFQGALARRRSTGAGTRSFVLIRIAGRSGRAGDAERLA